MKIKIGLFVALVLCAVFLLSCNNGEKDKIVQNGIEIENTPSLPYSADTDVYAKEVIFSLLEHYTKAITSPSLPQATIDKLKNESEKIQQATKIAPLNEEQYLEFFDVLSREGKGIIDKGLSASASLDSIRGIYKELSSITGAEYIGGTLYNLAIYYYDYKYQENVQNYEKYGYSFLLQDANAILEKKTILEREIGLNRFTSATQAMFFVAELFFGEAYKESTLDSFTSEETLILLKHLGFSLNDMTSIGWELLLSYIPASREGGYFSRLLYKAKENGDLTIIASNMNDIISFIALLQENLTLQDAEYVKNLSYNELLASLFKGLDDRGLAIFEKITTIELKHDDYITIAKEEFGAEYDSYFADVTLCTFDELKNSIGNDSFLKALEGYIAGAYPVLGYLLYD